METYKLTILIQTIMMAEVGNPMGIGDSTVTAKGNTGMIRDRWVEIGYLTKRSDGCYMHTEAGVEYAEMSLKHYSYELLQSQY